MTPREKGYFLLANEYADFLCFLQNELSINEYNNLIEKFEKDDNDNEPLSCGICDNCNVPILKNSGDGINEPLDPYLYCPKKNIEISPSPKEYQLKECEYFNH